MHCESHDTQPIVPVDGRPSAADQLEHHIAGEPAKLADMSAAFVRLRMRLQHYIRDLKEAQEQGLALDIALAAENLEIAAIALATSVRCLRACKASIETQIQAAMYECDALHEMIVALFGTCLRPSAFDSAPSELELISPVEQYPWLRNHLMFYAARIDRVFLEFR